MKLIFFISFLWSILGFTTFAQQFPDFSKLPNQIDSIQLKIEKNRSLEMTLPNESVVHEVLGEIHLDDREIKKFTKLIKKTSSYERGRALLNHTNLTFTCFIKEFTLEVNISTLTRNIDIHKNENVIFQGKISAKISNYLLELLRKYDFYATLHEIGDLEGLK